MKRVPLYQLLALIAVAGLALAAIRSGSLVAVRLAFALTMAVLMTAVLGLLLRARPFGAWLGFALFGCSWIAALTFVAPLTQVLGLNTFYTDALALEDLAEQIHPQPPAPAGFDPHATPPTTTTEDHPDPRLAAYARALNDRPERVRNSASVIMLTSCLVMGLIGSIVGRVLESRRAAPGLDATRIPRRAAP